MARRIARQILGIAALLSSASMAASVEVRPNLNSTPQPGACVVIAGRCELTIVSPTNSFYVIVHGISMPQTPGATLGSLFSTVTGTGSLTMTGATLASTTPSAGNPMHTIVVGPPAPPWTKPANCNTGPDCPITVLASPNAPPSGTVDAYVMNFTASCSTAVCVYNIDVYDDGDDFSWTDTNAGPIPATYTQARVILQTPIPAGVWLLGSALGMLGWVRHRSVPR
jgi:hypothetical protein